MTTYFKDLKIGEYFMYMGAKYEKVILSQDVFGTYNAISRTASTGAKVLNVGENTIVQKVTNDTSNT
jgi:hypothetical protein